MGSARPGPLQFLLQAIAYVAFVAFVGYFSASPSYTHFDPDKALIKLSFSHAAQRKEECRKRSAQELANMAANMRREMDCSRERLPLVVELDIDGIRIYRESIEPAGLSKDGKSSAYRRFAVDPGRHVLTAHLRDSDREQGFDYEKSMEVELTARQVFVVDFREDSGGFIFH